VTPSQRSRSSLTAQTADYRGSPRRAVNPWLPKTNSSANEPNLDEIGYLPISEFSYSQSLPVHLYETLSTWTVAANPNRPTPPALLWILQVHPKSDITPATTWRPLEPSNDSFPGESDIIFLVEKIKVLADKELSDELDEIKDFIYQNKSKGVIAIFSILRFSPIKEPLWLFVKTLGDVKDTSIDNIKRSIFVDLLWSDSAGTRNVAVSALGKMKDKSALAILKRRLADENNQVVKASISAYIGNIEKNVKTS